MPPSISPPTPEALAGLLATHADRFAEKAKLGPLIGDDGASAYLPVLLGTPKAPATAFSRGIAAALHFQKNDDPTGEELVKECLLWPPRGLWREWRARWAAIDGLAGRAVALKLGSNLDVFLQPEEDEAPPEGMTVGPGEVWRILQPQGAPEPIHVLLAPPEDHVWSLYVATCAQGQDVFARTIEVVTASVRHSSMPLEALFARWPGTCIALVAVVSQLAGVGAKVTLGEW